MRDDRNRQCKCICPERAIEKWRVIREEQNDCVVQCRNCRHVWHTTARYAQELERQYVTLTDPAFGGISRPRG